MKRHVRFCSVFSFFAAVCCHYAQAQMCTEREYRNTRGQCLPCAGCPPGEEPDRKCGFGEGLGMICKRCSPGAFSSSYGVELCASHTRCEDKKRVPISPGTAAADALCGDCIPGYYSPEGETDPRTTCLPCASAPKDMPGCPGSRKWLTRLARNAEASHRRDGKPPLNSTREGKPEENATQYAVLAIVPVFCVMGLLGILFCNLLMKKGYHCTARKDEEGAKAERNGSSSAYRIEDANEDTIGVLVRLITEKKENAAVLEEMLKDYHSKQLMQPVYKPVNKFRVARIPEQKPSPSEVKTISESAGAESTESPYVCLVPGQKPLVGNTVRPKWLTTGDGQQEVVI